MSSLITWLPTIIVFILMLGILIFFHELGHFLAAIKAGMRVKEFGFGFPPRIFGLWRIKGEKKEMIAKIEEIEVKVEGVEVGDNKEIIREVVTDKIKEIEQLTPFKRWRVIWGGKEVEEKEDTTVYSLNLIPLGGFVRILGEDEEDQSPQAFGNRSIGSRIGVVVCGVLMNFVLAYFAFLIAFWASLPPLVSMPEKYGGKMIEGSGGLYVEIIEKGSLAEKNGIRTGDTIIQIEDIKNPQVGDLRKKIGEKQNGEVFLKIQRPFSTQNTEGKEIIDKEIKVGESPILGVGVMERLGKVQYRWYLVPYFALLETGKTIFFMAAAIIMFLKNLIVTGAVPGEVLGPVGIFGITSVAVKLGFAYVLNLLIILTINLGIINILPFPALDGGRLVFLVLEKIRSKKLSQNIESAIHRFGFLFLLFLLLLVTWRDILRF